VLNDKRLIDRVLIGTLAKASLNSSGRRRADRRRAAAAHSRRYVNAGILTRNEARELGERPAPDAGADALW